MPIEKKQNVNDGTVGIYKIRFDGWGCSGNRAYILATNIQFAIEDFHKVYKKADPFITKIEWKGWAGDGDG